MEISVDDTLLTAHINPYFLRLNFPRSVVEDDNATAQYNPSTGYLTVTLTKEVKGQYFPDLDLLAKLLAPRPSQPPRGPSIQVLAPQSALEDDIADISSRAETLSLEDEFVQGKPYGRSPSLYVTFVSAAKDDWQLPQTIPSTEFEFHTTTKRYYGFLDMYTGYFAHVAHTENEINELGDDVETCPVRERRTRRLAHEDAKWDEEHYMFVRWRHSPFYRFIIRYAGQIMPMTNASKN